MDVPSAQSNGTAFAEEVLRAAERLGAESVLPGTEAGLIALAGRVPAVPAPEIVARALDKDALTELAMQSGLATPPSTHDGFPAIVKPARTKTPHSGGGLTHAKATVVRDQAELERARTALPGDAIVQPLLGGELGAVGGVAWDGEVVCTVHQRSLRIAPPLVGVSALAVTVPRDTALDAAVARLVRAYEWSGIFQLQVIWNDSVPYAIDFNPRMYGSLALAIGAGANLPATWADLVAGREPRIPHYRVGVTYRSEEKELQALVLALRRRDWATVVDCLRPRRATAHAAFARDDPLPLLGTLRRLAR